MSAVFAIASPRRIKASHRRRRKVTLGRFVQRYYDPQIGRFLSIDPELTNTLTGVHFNRFAYAVNNPYRFTDPDGRCAVACTVAVGAAAGAVFSGGFELWNQLKPGGTGFDGRKVAVQAGKGAFVGAVAGSFGLFGAGMAASAGAGKVGVVATSAAMAGAGAAVTTLAVSPAADVIRGDPLKSSGAYGGEALVNAAGSMGGATVGAVAERAAGRAFGAGLGPAAAKAVVEESASSTVTKALE